MTSEELHRLLTEAAWFSGFGGPLATFRTLDELFDELATWVWLPTTLEQADPVHGATLRALATDLGLDENRRAAELAASRVTLASLRPLPQRLAGLAKGPHDLTVAAKGAAVYAARMAAREIAVDRTGFWCAAVRLYHDGYWPCGLDVNGHLAIY